MSTLATLREKVKTLYKITKTDLDTFIDGQLNENLRMATRGPWYWRQLLVKGASFATTTGDQTYATSSDFGRIVPNSMIYWSDAATVGISITDTDIIAGEPFNVVTTSQFPHMAYVVAGTGSTKQIYLLPPFSDQSGSVLYDYYKNVTTLASTQEPAVAELEDYMVYKTLEDVAIFHTDFDRSNFYGAKAKQHKREATQLLTAQ